MLAIPPKLNLPQTVNEKSKFSIKKEKSQEYNQNSDFAKSNQETLKLNQSFSSSDSTEQPIKIAQNVKEDQVNIIVVPSNNDESFYRRASAEQQVSLLSSFKDADAQNHLISIINSYDSSAEPTIGRFSVELFKRWMHKYEKI